MNESTLVKVTLELPAEVVAYFDHMAEVCPLLDGKKSSEELIGGLLLEHYINKQANNLLAKVNELEDRLSSPENIMAEILTHTHAQVTRSENTL